MNTYTFRAEFLNGARVTCKVDADDLRSAVDEFDRRMRGRGEVVGLGVNITEHGPEDVDPDYYCRCGKPWLDHSEALRDAARRS
jgi:hypothetical protein